jgi:hypothetical protein
MPRLDLAAEGRLALEQQGLQAAQDKERAFLKQAFVRLQVRHVSRGWVPWCALWLRGEVLGALACWGCDHRAGRPSGCCDPRPLSLQELEGRRISAAADCIQEVGASYAAALQPVGSQVRGGRGAGRGACLVRSRSPLSLSLYQYAVVFPNKPTPALPLRCPPPPPGSGGRPAGRHGRPAARR